jgi:hypothetical protein
MDEGDPPAGRPLARGFIHQAVPGQPASFQRRIEIGNPVAYMMNTGAAFFEEPGDRAFRGLGAQQLDFGLAEGQGYDGGAIGGFRRMRNQAEHVTIERERRGKVRNRDADVSNPGCLGHWGSGHETMTTAATVRAAKVIGA